MSQSYPPPSYPPQEQSSSTIIWVVVLVLVLVVGLPILLAALMFLGCCGLMGVGMGFGAYSAFQISGDMAKQQYGDDPVIQQHIGEIQSISLNLSASAEESQQPSAAGASIMVFDVSGPKGSGQLIAEQQQPVNPQAGQMFSKAKLRTSQGEFPLSQ